MARQRTCVGSGVMVTSVKNCQINVHVLIWVAAARVQRRLRIIRSSYKILSDLRSTTKNLKAQVESLPYLRYNELKMKRVTLDLIGDYYGTARHGTNCATGCRDSVVPTGTLRHWSGPYYEIWTKSQANTSLHEILASDWLTLSTVSPEIYELEVG